MGEKSKKQSETMRIAGVSAESRNMKREPIMKHAAASGPISKDAGIGARGSGLYIGAQVRAERCKIGFNDGFVPCLHIFARCLCLM